MKPVCFWLLLFVFSVPLDSQNVTDFKKLYGDLFQDYKKEVLPLASTSTPLIVEVHFYLNSIIMFKEVDQTLSLGASILLNWNDPSIKWSPWLYGNTYSMIINPKDLWLPPIFIINRIDKLESFGSTATFYSSIVYEGSVFYSPGDVFDITCPTDISKFPFDTQTCEIGIMPWGILEPYLKFSSPSDQAYLSYFVPNADWSLKEYSVKNGTKITSVGTYSMFYVTLKLKRQPLYYIFMVILPSLLFAVLNPLVFVLPVDSGERMGLAMTIMLSYAIFLTLVSASIPASSNPMCVLLIVMIVIILISGIIVVGVIISSKYYHLQNVDEIGSLAKRLAKWRFRMNSKTVMPIDHEKELKVNGKDVAGVLDSLFFYGSYLTISVTVIGYFIFIVV